MSELTYAVTFKPPAFPKNSAGLKRGTVLEAIDEAVSQLGLEVGDRIPIGFNGEYVCCVHFTWDIEQLVDEIKDGIWSIVGIIDLSDPKLSLDFAKTIEGIEIAN